MVLETDPRPGDCCHLASADDYQAYFCHLDRVFAFLRVWYQKLVEGGNLEAQIVDSYLGNLLYTANLLRLKYQHQPQHRLALDLNDSGLPHFMAISELESDLVLQAERLEHLPSRQVLLEMMLDAMIRKQRDPTELLPQIAQVCFVEAIDGEKLIRPFVPGELKIISTGEVQRCLFSWLCYDVHTNMPYVHVMAFDYAGPEEELWQEYQHGQFLKVIRRYGHRIPTMAVLATSIDGDLPKVFPKILKRIRVGPIISPRFAATHGNGEMSQWLFELGEPGDFALILEVATIISRGQCEPAEGWLALFQGQQKAVRQIFAISNADRLSEERQATEVREVLLLPHEILQNLAADLNFNRLFGEHQKVSYDKKGGVYAV